MMNITLKTLVFALLSATAWSQPSISFTFDDGVTHDMPGYTFEQWNAMLLKHLRDGGVKTIFFVTGANKRNNKGKYLLTQWSNAGHRLGNHTFSHINYGSSKVTFEAFRNEFLRTDSIIRKYDGYIPMFRFPYLKEGDTRQKIDAFRDLLREHHYRNGAVTIDASDWYVDSRLVKRLRENPKADVAGFRAFYLQHLLDRAQYYESLSFQLTGRHIKHTLLLHHNLAAALFAGDLISMFKEKGWQVVDADKAFDDPIFQSVTTPVPAGEGLVWALAKQSGKFELRYPAEDGDYEKAEMDRLGL
ncbi:polysaccharide deacetylase family protein [Chryseolinea lacunae]|uniref:Polysaccharide deacetylase family protein n=1 Tax=Chryseolinea lacunae TaxID=2801331 RepID=A0ABS1KWE1_9BACT|nr:polysaccharide deacetylase family protein [Chryseolinea lacunae]MBL0743689.1 polysaccharide deacetylase family protein [Chryseolinea lacunae]